MPEYVASIADELFEECTEEADVRYAFTSASNNAVVVMGEN